MDIIGDIIEICIPVAFFGFLIAVFFFEIRPRHIKQFIEAPAEKLPVISTIDKHKVQTAYFGTTFLILVVVIAIVGFETPTIYDQLQTSDWKQEKGTVDISEVREGSSTSCDDEGCSTSYWDYPYIVYSYEVNGAIYWSNDIVLFQLDEGDYGFSPEIIEDYPVDSEISLYYNPQSPDESVLMKGYSGLIPPIVMVSQIIIGVYAVVTTVLVIWKIIFHIQPSSNRKKAEASPLDVFDIQQWDSKSDGQQIVDWYNQEVDDDKTIEDFMAMCGIFEFDSKHDALGVLYKAEKLIKIRSTGSMKNLKDKSVIKMTNAVVTDGCLVGKAVDHPELGTQRVATSSIVGMMYDEEGACIVETRNTAYMVETKDWKKDLPANHPSLLSDKEWWD
jgi:hypothetical protein|tara:strand:- start:54 stop:1220 length:1167 start_codon:yes stop_codon:yes gene_type:complete